VAEAVALRILIVEDNRDSADSLKALLEALGYRTQVVYDGQEAVRAAASAPPDVIIMDLGLPGLSGYEAAQQIRVQNAGAKPQIIALTGWGKESDRQRSAAAGFDHHLVKPLDLAELQRILALRDAQAPG
jgi:CheY-like chemotaxis protein